jgi:hypothetical protein
MSSQKFAQKGSDLLSMSVYSARQGVPAAPSGVNSYPRQILDFSNAQRNGFIDAFIDYMCSRIPGWSELSAQSQGSERKNLHLQAQALLIGCKVHWQ